MQKTNSQAVESHAYDPLTKILTVRFKAGNAYNYHEVTNETMGKLDHQGSFMGFMRENVMGKHNSTKL
jgi:hypothetical protein